VTIDADIDDGDDDFNGVGLCPAPLALTVPGLG